jgi:hypothetical protein
VRPCIKKGKKRKGGREEGKKERRKERNHMHLERTALLYSYQHHKFILT